MSNEPITNQGTLYASGGQMAWASNTTVTVTAGQFRDITNTYDMNVGNYLGGTSSTQTSNVTTTLNAGVNGLNGLDTGALAANTWYYVYVTFDSTGYKPTGVIASLTLPSAGGPYQPLGYSAYRRVGQFLTDGSSHILKFYQAGTKSERAYQWDAAISVLTSSGSVTPVAVTLNTATPSLIVTPVYLNATFAAATAANSASLRPTGGTGFPVTFSSDVITVIQKLPPFRMIPQFNTAGTPVQSIDYETTSGSDGLTLAVSGYEDYI